MKTPTVGSEPVLSSSARQDYGPKSPRSIQVSRVAPGDPYEAKIGPDEMAIDFSTAVSDISVPSEVRTKGASGSSPSPGGVREGEAPAEPMRSKSWQKPPPPGPAKPIPKNFTRAPLLPNPAHDRKPELDSGQSLVKTTPDSRSDTGEYEKEQSQIQAKEKAEFRAAEELKRKRDEAWAAARRAKPAEPDDEDSDRPFFERWKKPLIGVAAALLLAVIGYYGRDYWRSHRKVDLPLDADTVWQDYSSDPAAANKKYAHHRFAIVGKIIIEQPGKASPRRVYFQAPGEARLRIHCTFSAPNELMEVPNGSSPGAYLITGEFKPYEAGPEIEFSNCEFIGGVGMSVSALGMLTQPGSPGADATRHAVGSILES
jgi:hypothetical protein